MKCSRCGATLTLVLECAEEEPPQPELEAMTAQQVAELFHQSVDWVYARKDTKLRSARLINVGKSVRFSRSAIDHLFRQWTGG